jgi:serine/threonine protein kinase
MKFELTTEELIFKIKKARTYTEVFLDLSNWHDDYKEIVKRIHPDKCSINGALEALSKLNVYRDELNKGKIHTDDAGEVNYKIDKVSIEGQRDTLNKSQNFLYNLLSYKEDMDISFQRYIPKNSILKNPKDSDKSILDITLTERCVPLSALGKLPQGHVNWILSRMIEFTGYLHLKGYVHGGINPDSIYVDPLNHGINVISFYHATPIGEKLTTASGKYFHFYPEHVKNKKIATTDIDIELCKKTAIYMLGEHSGIGTALRKTHNTSFLDFISKSHTDAIDAFKDYRSMLNKNFERKFIPLII